MKVWILKKIGLFLVFDFEYDVPPSPLDGGGVLMFPSDPYMSIAPPDVLGKQIAVAVNPGSVAESWQIKPDLRGSVYWLADGSMHEIADIGVTIPANGLPEAPPLPVVRINAAQFRQQLIMDGNNDLVVLAIESISDIKKRKLVAARYEFESFFNIDDPDLLMLAGAVGYDSEEKIQEFFDKASQL
jgi:hypothetical protein